MLVYFALLLLIQLRGTKAFLIHTLPITKFSSSGQFKTIGAANGFAREERRIMPSDLYKKRKNPRNIAQQSRDRPRPKKVQPKNELPKAPPIVGAMSCSCKSGNTYDACCQPLHTGQIVTDDPVAVLKARYTAYKHGLAGFIIDSTHPKNSDFDKYVTMDFTRDRRGIKKWEKEINYMAADNTYLGLKVLSSDADSEAGIATVTFQTILKDEDGLYVAAEEQSLFTKNRGGSPGRWLYVDGELSHPSDQDFNALFEEFGDPADLDDGDDDGDSLEDNDCDDVYTTTEETRPKILNPAAEAALAGGVKFVFMKKSKCYNHLLE